MCVSRMRETAWREKGCAGKRGMSCHKGMEGIGWRAAMTDSAPTAVPSKARVFVRRAGSTLMLWGMVGVTFASMQSWTYLGMLGLLTLMATREYFKMLRVAGMRCFPRFR